MTIPQYRIRVLPGAEDDIRYMYRYIAYELFQPVTARRYRRGIHETIRNLSFYGGLSAVSFNDSLRQQYGPEVRTARYKKMTNIYTLINYFIIVHRVVAGSMVI